ncbi:sigma factor [Nonomuraea sp. NPDC050202]|uniref:sigma factor n=1 Tax=Nonomuraea sp. NPDC050202 TaxID=3155035 RepID=UPI0033C70877
MDDRDHRRDRYDPERGDLRPWLFGIATNLISRHRRRDLVRGSGGGRLVVVERAQGLVRPERAERQAPGDEHFMADLYRPYGGRPYCVL